MNETKTLPEPAAPPAFPHDAGYPEIALEAGLEALKQALKQAVADRQSVLVRQGGEVLGAFLPLETFCYADACMEACEDQRAAASLLETTENEPTLPLEQVLAELGR